MQIDLETRIGLLPPVEHLIDYPRMFLMIRRSLLAIGVAFLAVCSLMAQGDKSKPILIRGVTIIDCAGDTPRPGMSVLIANGHIQSIRPVSKLKGPVGAVIIDGRGKYLIPGLWNMHVHLGSYPDGRRALTDFLAEGVTGVRDMGSPLDDIVRLRKDTADSTIIGPELVIAGPIIQGPLPFEMPVFISAKDSSAARQAVDMLQARGVDFIKVQDAIPHDIYMAVAEEARKDGLPFVGHIPPTVLAGEASDLGQHSIEHLGGRFWGVLLGSSSHEAELHAEEVQMYQDILSALDAKKQPPVPSMRAAFTRRVVESFDEHKAEALLQQFKKNDTWQCPTLVVLHTLWADGTQYSTEDLHWADKLIAKETALISRMQKDGIGLFAGTDMPATAKNGTIHDEMAALVDAGLTPLQALEAATSNPARFLERSKDMGSIEKGKVANLVLLDANPLQDIRNTRLISAVILRGQLVSREPSDTAAPGKR
jgi:imidazolonepropionase-like amidohydrolase